MCPVFLVFVMGRSQGLGSGAKKLEKVARVQHAYKTTRNDRYPPWCNKEGSVGVICCSSCGRVVLVKARCWRDYKDPKP